MQVLTGILTVLIPAAMHGVATSASGDVTALHEQMLDALDRADPAALQALMTESPTLFVLDQNAQPVTLRGSRAALSYVTLWARDIEDPEPARLLSCWVVSESPSTTVVALEFERPTSDVTLFRATSTLVPDRSAGGAAMRIQHLHVSPASRQDLE